MRHLTSSKTIRALQQRQRDRFYPTQQQTHRPSTFFYRIKFALIAAVIGLLLGGLFDFATSIFRALAQPNASAEFVWFLAYIFAAIGAITGFCFGPRSGELFTQIFATEDHGESQASSELIRLIAKVLLMAGLLWSVFLIFL